VKAYIIPADQHDPLTAGRMVNKLLGQGITVEQATREFTHQGRVYGAGTHVVSMAQPKRGVIRWLLGRTFYPDNSYTRDRDGNPIRPYDMSTDNISEFMGVRVDPARTAVSAPLTEASESQAAGTVTAGTAGFVVDGRLNDAFKAVNLLFDAGVPVRRAAEEQGGINPGDFVVGTDADASVLEAVAAQTGVDFSPLSADPGESAFPVRQQRIGLFQRYYGGNMDEGWTRWLLEDFEYDYTTIRDDEILRGDLRERWDVIVLPADSKDMMVEGNSDPSDTPPEYRSGFGEAGVQALEEFVENGGTLVTFAQAGDLALDELDLPVRNAVRGVWGNDFWSPGSTLRMQVDNTTPFTWGMPEDALATYLAGGQVYETVPGGESADVRRLATYPDRDILHSGWLLGEATIANKAAMVAVEKGRGTILMIGFRAQHRAQTHGTFKLLFNALMERPTPQQEVAAAS
ncbi:MAG: peptidase M14 family protein, partial [Gemmatimonadetes bacterium]|nr:peptidase M14 family protein [Gemmatimonadota bacterium]